jgi:hypothetical protein
MLFLNSWYIYTLQVWADILQFVVRLVVIGDFLRKVFCKEIMYDEVG